MILQKDRIEHIQAWQAGGLTQAMYCQQQGLNAKTFSRWFKTYQLSVQSIKPLLIPVEMKAAADTLPATGPIWLRLSKGHTVEMPGNISPRWLAELLQCLV